MDLDINTVNALFTNGGIFGTIVAIVMILRFVWKTIGKDLLDRTKDSAEANIIVTMTGEIRRLNEEIQNIRKVYGGELTIIRDNHHKDLEVLRETHTKEQKILNAKLTYLEQTFNEVCRKNDSLKSEALQTYAMLNSMDISDPETIEKVKNRLLSVVFKEEPAQHNDESENEDSPL